ncbi:MAG TPA: hypothetical protein VHE36_08650 [Sphingomicrobium sp.]|nr:hypothetical protein [Sphingomicrobium sp.]
MSSVGAATHDRRSKPGGPPALPFVLSVGITGHRAAALDEAAVAALPSRIAEVLKAVRESAGALLEREPASFSHAPPTLRFISAIADGSDQIAADAAVSSGWDLQAILPFARAEYRASLADQPSRERLDDLLERAKGVLELPGEGPEDVEGYVMVGRATVAHCDVLIAVWDGLPPRGRGGTAEVVQMAITRGRPVIHMPPEPDAPARILWAAFDPVVDTSGIDPMSERDFDKDHIDRMLTAMLLPPPDQRERKFLAHFFGERMPRFRFRVEYRLLLAAAGIRRFRLADLTETETARWVEEEWKQFREKCIEANAVGAPIDLLEEAYNWADRLATNLALTYRSGHIFGFVFGGLAVCMGLGAFMFPHFKIQEAFLEILVTLAVILNAHIGTKREWHRRWLDYRQLAERLRPMRSLKLLGIAAPDPPGTETNPVAKRWIDSSASGIWRAVGCPAGAIDPATAERLARAVADHEIEPQVSYHKRNARVIELLDQRLERVGTILFFATLVVSDITLVGLATGEPYVTEFSNWFTLISAGFPALATAIFGIRFQGDFGGDALRSLATADTLGQIDFELRKNPTLSRAADLTEQAARFMLSDLDEWRLVNQQRDLSVG